MQPSKKKALFKQRPSLSSASQFVCASFGMSPRATPALHSLLLGALGGLHLVPASQQEQPQVDGEPVGESGGHQRAAGDVVGRGATSAQQSGQGQEARVPEHGAGALVGVHLIIAQVLSRSTGHQCLPGRSNDGLG